MSRWVRLSCDIFEHPLFERSEFSEREAWIWLVTRAAWKTTRHRVGREMMEVPRGSLFITLREMQVAWGWRSDARVRSFLGIMEREGMIERTAHAGKTQITICNYDRYQDAQRTENAQGAQEKRTENALKIPEYQDIDISSLRSDSARDAAPKPKPEKQSRKKPARPMPERYTEGSAAYNVFEVMVVDGEASWDDFDRLGKEFTDYHAAKGSLFADWDAAFRTWVRNDRKFRASRSQRFGSQRFLTMRH